MAIVANGTKFHKLNTSGDDYEITYTNVITGGELGGEKGDIDITTLDSCAKEYLPGMLDNGEMALEMLTDQANFNDLENDFNTNAVNTYAVTFPVGIGNFDLDKKFTGYVKSCKITGIEVDGVLKISAVIKISGGLTKFDKTMGTLDFTLTRNVPEVDQVIVDMNSELGCGNYWVYREDIDLETNEYEYGCDISDCTNWDGKSIITSFPGGYMVIFEVSNGVAIKYAIKEVITA